MQASGEIESYGEKCKCLGWICSLTCNYLMLSKSSFVGVQLSTKHFFDMHGVEKKKKKNLEELVLQNVSVEYFFL